MEHKSDLDYKPNLVIKVYVIDGSVPFPFNVIQTQEITVYKDKSVRDDARRSTMVYVPIPICVSNLVRINYLLVFSCWSFVEEVRWTSEDIIFYNLNEDLSLNQRCYYTDIKTTVDSEVQNYPVIPNLNPVIQNLRLDLEV